MFKVISEVNELELKKYPISSQTVLVGDLFVRTAGATTWAAATATSRFFDRKVIAYEAASTTATEFLGYEVRGYEDVEAEVANTANADHNGDLMILTDKNTVNNTGTTSTTEYACFMQTKTGKDTTHIIGKILVGNGVDPDATTT